METNRGNLGGSASGVSFSRIMNSLLEGVKWNSRKISFCENYRETYQRTSKCLPESKSRHSLYMKWGEIALWYVCFEFLNKPDRLFRLQSCSFTCTVVVLLGKQQGQEKLSWSEGLHTFYQCRCQYVVQAANKWCGKSSGVESIGNIWFIKRII